MQKIKTVKQWEAHIKAWEESGLTKTEYCARQGVSRSLFYKWQKVIKEKFPEPSSSFIPVTVEPAQKGYCEIYFKDLGKIIIERREALAELIEIIKAR